MNAVPNNVVAFELPKKPRIKQKDAPPDQRKISIVPIRAIADKQVTDGMFRVFAALASYCNRAGITWVSQGKLAKDMGMSQQGISKQITKLKAAGYVEVVRKGFRAERPDTTRVIFDSTIKTEDAIAVTSSIEDTRPPIIKEKEMQEAEEIDRAGQAKIAQMLAKGLKQINQPKERSMPKEGDTLAVRKMKEGMRKAQAKRSPSTTSEVVHGDSLKEASKGSHIQPQELYPSTTSEVVENTPMNSSKESIKVIKGKEDINKDKSLWTVITTEQAKELKSHGLTDQAITEGLDILTAAYAAEGLTPKSQHLVDGLLQMHRDAR